jgi:ubiquinone biosynthesis protein UbiJ
MVHQMSREFDRNETERQQYIQDHSSTKHLKERITELESEVERLKKKIEKLEDK